MAEFRFSLADLPAETETLRREVRAFLSETLPGYSASKRAASWGGYDAAFSRKLGERGWIGMTWPKTYGGHEQSALERYVVLEEMLAAGAPVSAHWIADRQSGPLMLRFGTEAQRRQFLPKIARGECFFSIGMSEPDSGSDLASVRTRAERHGNGWRVNGTKLWTSNAHLNHYMIALLRTRPNDAGSKHAGLTQFIVDLKSEGLTIRPITDLSGRKHFNEIVFRDVFVPDEMRIGNEGDGWRQVSSELAFERSGPERYLSAIALLLELVRIAGKSPSERAAAEIGRLVAHLATLRRMSIALAHMLDAGEDPATEAALVKDLGTTYEQEIPEIAQRLLDIEPSETSADEYARTLAYLMQFVPSFSLRGGTREVLRGIIARGLGLR
jgi:alkylation response protein AidB-like acyl-CoA dehydrogenase